MSTLEYYEDLKRKYTPYISMKTYLEIMEANKEKLLKEIHRLLEIEDKYNAIVSIITDVESTSELQELKDESGKDN